MQSLSAAIVSISTDPESLEVVAVRDKIEHLKTRFNALKRSTVECLNKVRISVLAVASIFTTLCAIRQDDYCKMFLGKNIERLNQSQDHWELFGSLNVYWSYLSYHLLKHLIVVLAQRYHSSFTDVKAAMYEYKEDLQRFRMSTKLTLFYKAENVCIMDENDPPQDFRKVTVTHNICCDNFTLDDIEKFRQRYSSHYNLQSFAMIMSSIVPGSLIVTWFIPLSVIEIVTKEKPIYLFKDFNVSTLELDGICVHLTFSKSTNASSKTIPATVKRCVVYIFMFNKP